MRCLVEVHPDSEYGLKEMMLCISVVGIDQINVSLNLEETAGAMTGNASP